MSNPQPWWLTWPVAEVAAAILPLFPYSPGVDEISARASIISWCKTGSYRRPRVVATDKEFDDPDTRAIAEAIQVLEHAGLLMRAGRDPDYLGTSLGLTRLGQHALATSTVRQHLGLSDTPPAA